MDPSPLQAALDAVNSFFADTSTSKDKTLAGLEEIQALVEDSITAIA